MIHKNLTINNNSGESITISGNNVSRVFNINSGKTVRFSISVNNGKATDGTAGNVVRALVMVAAILNETALTRVNVTSSHSGNCGFHKHPDGSR